MFAIGTSEPLDGQSVSLVRHSIVWLGGGCGETNVGLPATHPLCLVLLSILEHFKFVGTWMTCRELATLRDFERKVLLIRFNRTNWLVDPEQSDAIRAHRVVAERSPWPYTPAPALPWPQLELLVVGGLFQYSMLECGARERAHAVRAVRSEAVVLQPSFSQSLLSAQAYAICVGRTHTDNSPGLSVIGPRGLLSPERFVGAKDVLAIHRDGDAERAWSYARVEHTV